MRKKRRKSESRGVSLKEQIIGMMARSPFKGMNYRQISKQLGIMDKDARQLVRDILDELLIGNILVEEKRGKYKLHAKYITKYSPKTYVEGKVDMKQTGKAYVVSDSFDEDIFIAQGNTGKALHGDWVKVFLFPKRRNRKHEGQIIEVIKRNKTQFVGIMDIKHNYSFMIPDQQSMPFDLFVHQQDLLDAKNGDKVIAEITDWPDHARNPFAKVVKVLGKPGDNNVEMQSILMEYDLPIEFPQEVLDEAANLPSTIPMDAYESREKFQRLTTFTIDPKDAKDFDDALSIEKLPNGNVVVGVHIADVSHFVQPGTAIDKEAYHRATSVYLVDRVVPMLPEVLSNGLCSLVPKEDRFAMSVMLELDEEMKVRNKWVCRSVIHSDRRYTYEEVQEVINGNDENDTFKEELLLLHGLAQKLRKMRFEKGSINMESNEVRFILDDDKKPVDVYVREHNESHELVEEFMLLANKTIAQMFGVARGNKPKPFVFRIHDEPNGEKLASLSKLCGKFGYKIDFFGQEALNQSLNKLLTSVKGRGEQNLIETMTLRAMAKAVYSTENIGHYGLGFKHYTHFTSPIRRYPDLLVHRLVWAYLHKGKYLDRSSLEEMCDHSSDMERAATDAERASVKYKQAEYLADKVGQKYCGIISGVSKWGVFVELKESFCEGMIRMQDLDDDYYYLDEDNYQVTGHHHHKSYKIGDEVNVQVKNVDVNARKIDLALVGDECESGKV